MSELRTERTRTSAEVVVARQPIVTRDREVVGFELLYRPAPDATAAGTDVDGEMMTAAVVLSTLTIGVDQLVASKKMFCNAERGVLLGETPVTLPPHRTVIEVLESVRVDDETVQGCAALKEQGFAVALDDFVWFDGAERLLELADVVKIDLMATSRDDVLSLVERCRPYDVRLLAEKCETDDDVSWAAEVGFELFQGYAIQRPEVIRGTTIAPSALTQVQLAMTLLTDDLDFDEIEDILRREPGLVLQVLQLASVGSHRGMRRQVRTVREALVLLGTTRIRQWVALTILGGQKGGRTDALATALVRARMCELAAADAGLDAGFAFTAGLLSALDLLLGVPVQEIEGSLDLDDALVAAAFHGDGPVGAVVRRVTSYQIAVDEGLDPGEELADLDASAPLAFLWAMPYVNSLENAG
ncbi:MAG: EAL domain-containing protein [Nocardioidaceae bacterium]|nr:EAL domain-containing protein [Nocardioidaceae bacterium]NUS52045.1 EAL domain-containing protein [Nocardioidaceae bacterium]